MEKFDWKLTISRNILILKIVGLWPPGDDTYTTRPYTLYSFICILFFICGHYFFQTVNMYFIFPDLEAISGTIYVTLSQMMTMLKSYYMIQNMGILKQLMITVNSDLFQPRNSRQIELVKPSLTFWKTVSNMFRGVTLISIFFWATYPIIDKSTQQRRLPFLAWYPYDTTVSPLYEFTYIYQIIGVSFIAAAAVSMDTLIAALNMFIGAQCDLLCDNLRHLPGDEQDFNRTLIKCILHHKEILRYKKRTPDTTVLSPLFVNFRFARDTNNFFNWIVLVQFFISAASIGITMFQLTVVSYYTILNCLLYKHFCRLHLSVTNFSHL
jgi:hypothetical protein